MKTTYKIPFELEIEFDDNDGKDDIPKNTKGLRETILSEIAVSVGECKFSLLECCYNTNVSKFKIK